jgi:hypothetical protein
MRTNKFLFCIAIVSLMACFGFLFSANAQEPLQTSVGAVAEEPISELDIDVDAKTGTAVDTSLEGIKLNVPEKAPSALGLFWRGIKEKISIGLTLDPVKKAEKQVKYAEERMQIAEKISASSNDPTVQAKMEKVVEKANDFIAKVEEKKEEWVNKKEDKVQQLIKNIAVHNIRRERILDKIEEKLPDQMIEKFQEKREQVLETNKRLLNAIQNKNIKEDVKQVLEMTKERIEQHAEEVKEFKEEHKQLMQDVFAGDEAAKAKIEQIREERKEEAEALKEKVMDIRQDLIEKKQELKQKVKDGDAKAAETLEAVQNGSSPVQTLIEYKQTNKAVKMPSAIKSHEQAITGSEPGSAGGAVPPVEQNLEKKAIIDPIFKPNEAQNKPIKAEPAVNAKENRAIIDPIFKDNQTQSRSSGGGSKTTETKAIIDPIFKDNSVNSGGGSQAVEQKAIIDPIFKPTDKAVSNNPAPTTRNTETKAIIDPIFKGN